jgi:hypothetical protein
MPTANTKSTYQKRRRRLLRYDMDILARQVLFTIVIILEDRQNNIVTPITPLYEARLETYTKAAAAIDRDFDPRQIECCFVFNNTPVIRTVYVPYLPGSVNHKGQTQETLNYSGVVTGTYQGESHSSNYEAYL